MNNKTTNKSVILAIIVILFGLGIAGGTYAFLTLSLNVVDGVYNVGSHCFLIDYGIDNGDGTQNIEGTMFPSSGPVGGLDGKVSLKISDSCSLVGNGTVKLHINSETSNKFTTVGAAHCENPNTLETMHDYTTSGSCTSNSGSWTSTTTPLKYAVYTTNDTTGTPIAKGYIVSGDIGNDKTILSNIDVNRVLKEYYIYFWLDGYMTDNTYVELPFSGYISAEATQKEDVLPNGYQRVEYIESSGSQYILTDIIPTNTTGMYAKVVSKNITTDLIYFGTRGSTNARFWVGNYTNKKVYVGWNGNITYYSKVTTTSAINEISVNYLNNRKSSVNNDVVNSSLATLAEQSYPIAIFAGNNSGTVGLKSSIQLYDFKISEGSKITHEFIPCYKTSGTVIGLYDIMNGVFYPNNGSGTFTKGPNI